MLKLLKNVTKAVVSPLLDATGLYDRRIDRACKVPGSWTIVMYHRVIEDARRDPFQLGMCVMRDRFERQIRYFCQRFNIISVAEGIRRCQTGEPLPQRALSVTFDDGYLDNLTRALPILQRHGVPFSVYVPTGGLQDGSPLWWDRAIAALAATRRGELDLQEVGLSEESDLRTLQGVQAPTNAEDILERLWALDPSACAASVEKLEQWLAPHDSPWLRAERLSVDQVRELHRQGVEIGAHSVTHPNLTRCGAGQAAHEITAGRETLESWLQAPVTGFAFPGGHVNESLAATVAGAGYVYGLSTEIGMNRPTLAMHRLRRVGMPDAEMPDFRRSVGGALVRGLDDGHVRF
jgi:peptidoglycan/xylan/chitin deacetylase (PgdA/CDA1 family)